MTKFTKICYYINHGFDVQRKLGGGAQLLYIFNEKDWLSNLRKRWFDVQKTIERRSAATLELRIILK